MHYIILIQMNSENVWIKKKEPTYIGLDNVDKLRITTIDTDKKFLYNVFNNIRVYIKMVETKSTNGTLSSVLTMHVLSKQKILHHQRNDGQIEYSIPIFNPIKNNAGQFALFINSLSYESKFIEYTEKINPIQKQSNSFYILDYKIAPDNIINIDMDEILGAIIWSSHIHSTFIDIEKSIYLFNNLDLDKKKYISLSELERIESFVTLNSDNEKQILICYFLPLSFVKKFSQLLALLHGIIEPEPENVYKIDNQFNCVSSKHNIVVSLIYHY